YHRLRDLFSLKPDLVLYDITSTYFEGAGPQDFAKHGYSRDGKSQNVQVIIGMVMVAGWPIAHHVWAGNRIDHSTVQEVISDLCNRFEFGRLIFVGDRRVIVIDSDERRGYEQAKREQAMERARQRLEKLKERIAAGDLKRPEKIGAAVERIMQKYHGHRYFDWKLNGGALELSESETHLGREKKIEGRYVIMTSEKG